MNLKQIAQKLWSKTQDDEGLIRSGKFTPLAPLDDKIKSTVSNIRIGSGPTLGQAVKQVTSRGTQAFNPYQGIAENKSNNAFLRGGADIVNQGLKSFTNMSTLGLVQPKMGERQTKAGLVGSIGGGLAGFAVNPLGKVMGSTDTLVSRVAPKATGLTSKVLKGLSSEALQTLGYSGASLLGSKLGLNQQTGQFTPKDLATNMIFGSVIRGGLSGSGAIVKSMTGKNKMTFKPKSVLKGEEIDIIDQINERLVKAKDISWEDNNFLDNVLKQRTNATQGQLDNLTAKQKLNELLTFANKSEGFKGVTMGITDQPIKTGIKYKTINEGGIIKEVEGKPIKLVDGVETFIHKGDNPKRTVKGFVISEKSTGRYLASGETESEAIRNAKNLVDNMGENTFKQKLSQVSPIKTGGDIEHKTNVLFDKINAIDDKLNKYHGENVDINGNWTPLSKSRRTQVEIQIDILAKQKQKLLDELDRITKPNQLPTKITQTQASVSNPSQLSNLTMSTNHNPIIPQDTNNLTYGGQPRNVPYNLSPESVSQQEIKRVGANILKNNHEIGITNAEAMAKDVIEGRKFNTGNLSPESKGIKPVKNILPWEEPSYVSKNLGLKTKESPVLKTGILKQELNQLTTKAPLKDSQRIISPELKTDIKKVENLAPKKVNLLDWFRTPDRVLNKIGLGNEAKEIRTAYNKYLDELPVEISKVTKWYDQVKSLPDASKRLFQYLDGQDVTLNKTELKVAGEIKDYLKQWADKLDLPYDKRVTNYITHIFEKDFIKKDFDEDLAKIISEKVPGSVYDPFTQERLGKQGYIEDVFRSLDAYIKRGVRKFNMDPALEKLSNASNKLPLESWKYVKSFADRVNLRPTEIDNYIDNLVKESPIGYKLGARPVTTATKKLRQAVYRGTLGLNVGSALRNLTQGVNTYAELGEKYTPIGYIRNLKEMATGGDELKQVGVLRDDLIQDRQISAVKGVLQKLDEGLFSLFNLAEKINRGSAYFGAKAKYLDQGLSEKEAIEKAVDLVRKTQFTFGSVDTPVAMQSDLAKTLGQFQSFNLKQAEFLGEKIASKDILGLLRWIGGNALMMFTVGKLIGIDIQDIIPFGGVFTGETKLGVTPPVQLGSDIYGAITNTPDKYGNVSEEGTLKRVGNALAKNAPAWIPAGVQAKKTIQGIQAVGQEGSFSKSGRLQYPIEKTPENYIRAGLFGKSNLPAAKEYFDKNGQVLGEKQTELYKQSTDKQGVYKQIQEERKTTNELETQKKEFENNGIQSKQVGDKILYLNENNNVSILDLSKFDDIANLPSDNKYNSAIKESKQYSEAAKIMDNTALTIEQQQTALDRLGIDKTNADYYRIANDSDNLKTMFVLDAVNNIKTQGGGLSDVISLLANQRTEINGKMIASNAVLDNLVDEGILSKAEATNLKKYKFENNTLVPIKKSTGSGKKAKKITFKVSSPKALPKITLKISSPVSRVKLKSTPKIKLSKTANRKYTIKA